MLELAVAGTPVGQVEGEWSGLDENERRLIRRFRQMTELDRHQVKRLIDQLARHPEGSES